MEVTCIPTRQIYYNIGTGFRVLSCVPCGEVSSDFKANKYGEFTINGCNLSEVTLFDEITLTVMPDTSSKYDGSYKVVGTAGLNMDDDKIVVNPNQEYTILRRFMTDGQAKNVNSAYPNFVQLIMDGNVDAVDVKRIKNVGEVYLQKYIEKLTAERNKIMLLPVASEYGIDDLSDIDTIMKFYSNADELKKAFENNPYLIMCQCLEYSFERADKLILSKNDKWIDSIERCEYACIHILKENEAEGDTRINANLLARFVKEIAPETMSKIVSGVTHSEKIHYDTASKNAALQNTYLSESIIADAIKKRLQSPNFFADKTAPDFSKYKKADGFECTEEQMQILKLIWYENLAMLTGSAGMGKTASMKAAVRMLEDNNIGYLLLAPTGIAAKRIKEATGRRASTIHRFLAVGGYPNFEGVIVLEESSMLGVHLLSMLLQEIGGKCKLLFVCDNAQLASISCGNVVQDILDSRKVPTATLTKVFRYGIGGIATLSADTRAGTPFNPPYSFPDYTFMPVDENAIKAALTAYEGLLQKGYGKEDIMVLCPYNKSKIGTYALNAEIQNRYNQHEYTDMCYERDHQKIMFKIGDKVVNTVNDYHTPAVEIDESGNFEYGNEIEIPCMNGDIGYVREIVTSGNTPFMIVEFDNGFAIFDERNIKNLLLGYALSIHRVQGAQAKAVIVVIDKSHKQMLSRNLLYVALSRAQKELVEIGDKDVINAALQVQENIERDTWLKDLLKENCDEN